MGSILKETTMLFVPSEELLADELIDFQVGILIIKCVFNKKTAKPSEAKVHQKIEKLLMRKSSRSYLHYGWDSLSKLSLRKINILLACPTTFDQGKE